MLCKELQTKIAVHEELTAAERRHAETCPECAAFAAFDANLDARLPQWRSAGSSFARRAGAGTEARATRRSRVAYAGLGLAAALTLGVLALPTRSTAQTAAVAYREMIGRVKKVGALHLVVRWRPGNGMPEDGPLRKTYELWWKPGAWREAWTGRPQTLKLAGPEGIAFYRYENGRVASYRETAAQPDFETFDLAKFAQQYMATPTRFERPNATTIVAMNAGGWSRMVFTINPTTGLPTHADKESNAGQGWRRSGEIDLEFNRAVPDDRFAPESLAPLPKP